MAFGVSAGAANLAVFDVIIIIGVIFESILFVCLHRPERAPTCPAWLPG
jgi:hypothetical protein